LEKILLGQPIFVRIAIEKNNNFPRYSKEKDIIKGVEIGGYLWK
jgi:hypothetical protein